jgi:protein-S-isoprenylcysteine O-methyltransferase Ste14
MLIASKTIWCLGVIAWFVIRYPYARCSRRVSKSRVLNRSVERLLLCISACGLGVIPVLFVFGGVFKSANYTLRPWQPWAGAILFCAALCLFRLSHVGLGRYWSVTLELKHNHVLTTEGIYNYVRHPMYVAFWLWALAQAVLLPNWIAGLSGLVGFGVLYFVRVGREEAMMIEAFGDQYRIYMRKTPRLFPTSFLSKSKRRDA